MRLIKNKDNELLSNELVWYGGLRYFNGYIYYTDGNLNEIKMDRMENAYYL